MNFGMPWGLEDLHFGGYKMEGSETRSRRQWCFFYFFPDFDFYFCL